MITANDLKTKGIACLEESLANQPEAMITVRGKESFVVMKIDHYHYRAKWNWKPHFMKRNKISRLAGLAKRALMIM